MLGRATIRLGIGPHSSSQGRDSAYCFIVELITFLMPAYPGCLAKDPLNDCCCFSRIEILYSFFMRISVWRMI